MADVQSNYGRARDRGCDGRRSWRRRGWRAVKPRRWECSFPDAQARPGPCGSQPRIRPEPSVQSHAFPTLRQRDYIVFGRRTSLLRLGAEGREPLLRAPRDRDPSEPDNQDQPEEPEIDFDGPAPDESRGISERLAVFSARARPAESDAESIATRGTHWVHRQRSAIQAQSGLDRQARRKAPRFDPLGPVVSEGSTP